MSLSALLKRARWQVERDLRTDPYLRYLLVLSTILVGFWFWHRIPNFATHDAFIRLVDPMVTVGAVVADPGFDSLQRGVLVTREFGATSYIYGIAIVPVLVAAALTGQLDVFADMFRMGRPFQRLEVWQSTPVWIWEWSLLVARLFVVVFAVGCVYLTYRIGVATRGRQTGRFAALLLTLTWGFVYLAHEVGEDVPALFFLLLVFALALRYVQTGEETAFLAGCAAGGIAIAVKLTGGISVFVLGAAYVLRARHGEEGWREALVRPRLLGWGLLLGVGTVVVGFPSVLVGGPDVLVQRVLSVSPGSMSRGEQYPSIWWWMVRNYLNGFGLPLFVAAIGGVAASVTLLRDRATSTDGVLLLWVALGVFFLVMSRKAYVRVHHLLPTFPLFVLLVAAALSWLRDRNPDIARPLVAILVVTSGVYAVAGDIQYATSPQDDATAWLDANVPDNATLEVYHRMSADLAVPHDMNVSNYGYKRLITAARSPNKVDVTRTEWILNMPKRCPEYIELGYRDLMMLDSDGPVSKNRPWEGFIRDLVRGEYPYRVVAEFGPRPPFLEPGPESHALPELLRAGLFPGTVNYGDEQDLRADEYTMILKRTGSCTLSSR